MIFGESCDVFPIRVLVVQTITLSCVKIEGAFCRVKLPPVFTKEATLHYSCNV